MRFHVHCRVAVAELAGARPALPIECLNDDCGGKCQSDQREAGRPAAKDSPAGPIPAQPSIAVKSNLSRNRILLRRTLEEAEGYTELGLTEHALRTLQRRGALVHGNGKACYMLGETLRELARYEEALLPLERSAALVPDDIHVYLALGWCYKRTGQLAKAIDALERAVEIDPAEPSLYYNLACYWSLARNRTLALRHLNRALDLNPNYREEIPDEPDFNPLRHDPEFKQLVSGNIVEQE
jgi:tetratricopeptide (TPR) repeat protein